MIYEISSDLKTFKSIRLKDGLNILLADKAVGAGNRQTRNGAGKSSLVELIHFIFGANADPDSIFRSEKLDNFTFDIRFNLNGKQATALRKGATSKQFEVQGNFDDACIKPLLQKETGNQIYTVEQWNVVLGHDVFGLKCYLGTQEDRPKYTPTFRMLFPYFVRRQYAGGFLDPQRNSENQQGWDQKAALSFLIELDSMLPGQFEALSKREGDIKALKKLSKSGNLELLGTAGDFRTKLAISEERVQKLKHRVDTFHIVDEYKELEREATRLTREIRELNDANIEDEILLGQLRSSLESEIPPATAHLVRLYEEAKVFLPDNVTRRFQEVEAFHDTVLENRRIHLAGEIEATTSRIKSRDREKRESDRRRAEIMTVLREGGALEHFLLIREEAGRAEAEVSVLRQKLDLAEKIETKKAALGLERAQLNLALQSDLKEREGAIKRAVLIFEQLSEQLYVNERAGNLYISPGKNGAEFEIKIEGERSKGISNMQIFCFDMMLMQICAERGIGPRFLVHDSHLFDGVDERQVAKALQIGAERSSKYNFQYIVTMNSDAVPKDGLDPDFNLDSYINPTRLTDENETGGLFGLRF